MSLSANETFYVVFFSAVLMFGAAAQSSSALFCRVYNQNVLCDLQKVMLILTYIFMKGWFIWLLCTAPTSSVKTVTAHIIATFILAQFTLTIHKYTCRLYVATADPSVVTNQWFCPQPTRCHSKHAASSITNGRDGVEANPAPHHHCPRNLPAASRKSLHLEKRVPGRDGEVSGGREEELIDHKWEFVS